MTAKPIPLAIENLTIKYHGQDSAALDSITLDFETGKMTAIVGPNGAGKSTLLKASLSLIAKQDGVVCLGLPDRHLPADRPPHCLPGAGDIATCPWLCHLACLSGIHRRVGVGWAVRVATGRQLTVNS